MDLLSISPSYPSASLRGLHFSPPKPSISAFNSRVVNPWRTNSSRTALKCMLESSPESPKALEFVSQPQTLCEAFQISSAQAPDPTVSETDLTEMMLRERIVFLSDDIDDFVADAIISQLLLLDEKDPTKEIKIFINSLGGMNIYASMAVYDTVQILRAPISTIAMGIVGLTTAVILGAGTKGKRLAMPNTRITIHQPFGAISGGIEDVEIQARESRKGWDIIAGIISGFTGQSFEQVKQDFEWQRVMAPIEAVEYGIIDGVIDRNNIIPLMPLPENVVSAVKLGDLSADPGEVRET